MVQGETADSTTKSSFLVASAIRTTLHQRQDVTRCLQLDPQTQGSLMIQLTNPFTLLAGSSATTAQAQGDAKTVCKGEWQKTQGSLACDPNETIGCSATAAGSAVRNA
jgi:hypothetical protein